MQFKNYDFVMLPFVKSESILKNTSSSKDEYVWGAVNISLTVTWHIIDNRNILCKCSLQFSSSSDADLRLRAALAK